MGGLYTDYCPKVAVQEPRLLDQICRAPPKKTGEMCGKFVCTGAAIERVVTHHVNLGSNLLRGFWHAALP